ncbi:hypothetical protein [Luteimicrobium subarcticum]|uniref:Uncharacterized protein n=1 Tax=Luteimicrobium subarcticum TaxID=620910 RepID=A0A2M8WSU5_9MICO|nr:hypothetical protein [Luteimicrobium subarcticum]PJI94025.1 hypothetical protein CLV34_1508 [Luteimicrobium subarcticum]
MSVLFVGTPTALPAVRPRTARTTSARRRRLGPSWLDTLVFVGALCAGLATGALL